MNESLEMFLKIFEEYVMLVRLHIYYPEHLNLASGIYIEIRRNIIMICLDKDISVYFKLFYKFSEVFW
jgi:hypothetical protein